MPVKDSNSKVVAMGADSLRSLPGQARMKRRVWYSILIIVSVSMIIYANTVPNGYALDDGIVITKNKFTQEGIKGIPSLMTTDSFVGFFGQKKDLVVGGRYRPLSLVTFAIELSIFGSDPHISHFINILLYALSNVILFLVLRKILAPVVGQKWWTEAALMAALLFAAHPIHTEVVANIKGRDEILSLLFSLLSFLLLLHFVEDRKITRLLASGIGFFLALLSKEGSIVLLLLVPLFLSYFTKQSWKYIGLYTLPFLLLSIIFLFLRSQFTGSSEGVDLGEVLNNALVFATPAQKYATIALTLGRYLLLLVLPYRLSHDYYYNQVPLVGWTDWISIVSVLAYFSMAVYVIVNFRKKSPAVFAIIFYFVTLFLTSNILFPVGTMMAERFLYAPSVGYCLVLAILIPRGIGLITWRSYRNRDRAVSVLLLLILCGYSYRTIVRNPAWKDNLTLFSTDVFNSPNSAKVQNALGSELVQSASNAPDSSAKAGILSEAITHLTRATQIYPSYADAWLSLGNAFYERDHNPAPVIACYKKSIELRPGYAETYKNLGIVYLDEHNYSDAIHAFRQYQALVPDSASVHYLCGLAYLQASSPDSALQYFKEAISLDSSNLDAYLKIGLTYGKYKHEMDSAIVYLEIATAHGKPDESIYENLGIAYAARGRYDKAIEAFTEALRLNPGSVQAYRNLGVTFQSRGDSAQAKRYFDQANKLARDVGYPR